jgi:hypothetical protein
MPWRIMVTSCWIKEKTEESARDLGRLLFIAHLFFSVA